MTVGRVPERVDLKLYAGDSETYGFTLTDDTGGPINTLVGEWAAQIKLDGAEDTIEAFTVILDLTTAGRMDLFIDAGASQRLGALNRPIRWDLQQTFTDGTVITHAGGLLVVTPDVTRVDL